MGGQLVIAENEIFIAQPIAPQAAPQPILRGCPKT